MRSATWSITSRTPRSSAGTSWEANRPTPDNPNQIQETVSADAVVFNEWMASPLSGEDWFELYNPGLLPARLGGYYLTSDPSKPTQSSIPQHSFIAARGFTLFTADGTSGKGGNHANFKLSSNGETITLISTNLTTINLAKFGLQKPGVSEGRLPDGAANIARFTETATPGESNYLPHPDVVINEVLSHSLPPLEDAID